MTTSYFTIEQLKAAHERAGGKFFTSGNGRFFDAGYGRSVLYGMFFISSEEMPYDTRGRCYTIRYITGDGDIATLGEYSSYGSGDAAKRALKQFVEDSHLETVYAGLSAVSTTMIDGSLYIAEPLDMIHPYTSITDIEYLLDALHSRGLAWLQANKKETV